ncbi:MAG: SET domain-containing protein-lysine N-methyltransferase [Burkholderiales bacterium]|nr:SET domain-containing protein-lysine N-methyltransferase [Burkholderiales bacterium]
MERTSIVSTGSNEAARSGKRAKRLYFVRKSGIHGRGVFAARRIAKGTRIIEYKGERVTHEEVDRRYADEPETDSHTFLFEIDDRWVIDAGVRGNAARWINHGCNPNCETVEEDGRIFIEAIREIPPGEELTYDYNITLEERHTPRMKRIWACLCGAKKCRGTMLARKR